MPLPDEIARYDAASDSLEIFGIRYALDLFKAIGIGPLGATIKIVERGDGLVTLQRIELEQMQAEIERLRADLASADRALDSMIPAGLADPSPAG